MELVVDALREPSNSVKANNQDEFKETKESYLIQSQKCCRSRNQYLPSVNNPIFYLLLISLICQLNGKPNGSCSGRVKLTKPYGFITDGPDNYGTDFSCAWLITAENLKTNHTLIRLRFGQFQTECGWDWLRIYSGESVFAPLVAAFSGVFKRSLNEMPEIEIISKEVYLTFVSDVAANASGFNLSYTIHPCKNTDCSDVSLAKQRLPQNPNPLADLTIDINALTNTNHHLAEQSFSNSTIVYSLPVCPNNKCASPSGRALHQSVLVDSRMYVVGGEFFQKAEANEQFIVSYDLRESKWNLIDNRQAVAIDLKRFGHSLVYYVKEKSLYVYGGVMLENGTISSDLWRYEIDSNHWSLVEIQSSCVVYCAPIASAGHTGTLIDDRLFILFGYNPRYGYLNTVQEFDFRKKAWSLLQPSGALVKGSFGHTSVYHEPTKTIFVFGGQQSSLSDSVVVDSLYGYHVLENKWRILTASKSPRYFHTAVILNQNQIFVFGGNSFNSVSNESFSTDQCFSNNLLIYNVDCDRWSPILGIGNGFGTSRFGHSAIEHENKMLVFGGFNSLMLNNLMQLIPANCSQQTTKSQCCNSVFVNNNNCVWEDEQCMEFNELSNRINTATLSAKKNSSTNPLSGSADGDVDTLCHPNFNVDRMANGSLPRSKCPIKFSNNNEVCKKITSCSQCVGSQCVWCNDSCSDKKCKSNKQESCEDSFPACQNLNNCHSCHTNAYCTWHINMCLPFVEKTNNRTIKAILHENLRPTCEPPCHLQTSCENCTMNGACMWCSSLDRCIESNAYGLLFGLGQCQGQWTISPSRCPSLYCGNMATCESCLRLPRCVWRDDGSMTGTGYCTEGNSKGPINLQLAANSSQSVPGGNKLTTSPSSGPNKHLTDITNRIINLDSLFSINKNELEPYSKPSRQGGWFYTECPICSCNGHTTCQTGSSICNKPCAHDTTGEHCEICKSGYYGNAINNGKCFPCKCNPMHSAQSCDKKTGKCFCSSKGVVGNHCDKCDEANHYYSIHSSSSSKESSSSSKESNCFYNLSIDFQYTFNMSKSEDKWYNKVSFMMGTGNRDLDIDFAITCSSRALFNISFGSATLPHRVLLERVECGTQNQFKYRFSHNDHLFGNNTSFFVTLYSFSYPFIVALSFSQHRALDLIQFFVTFSSCFLTLLILAAILWKVKQKYDMYRRRQQFFMELEHLASRPFAGILLELPNPAKPTNPVAAAASNDELSAGAKETAASNKQQSKLKAFTSAQRSHLKNFLHSSSNNTSSNAAGGDHNLSKTQQTPNSSSLVENPTPIALEPCYNNKAAVLSLIIRLPTGGSGVVPIGQTGIAIGSALVSLGPVEQKMEANIKNSNSNKKTNAGPAFV